MFHPLTLAENELALTLHHPYNVLCCTLKENIFVCSMFFIRYCKTVYNERRSKIWLMVSDIMYMCE